jgi:hypothetical protein
MKSWHYRKVLTFTAILCLVLAIAGSLACEPLLKIDINNQTSVSLTFSIITEPGRGDELMLGTVKTGNVLTKEMGIGASQLTAFTLIGRNMGGDQVYSQRLQYKEYSEGVASVTILPDDLTRVPS